MRSSEAVYQRNLVVKVLNNRFPGREQHQKLPFTTIVHDQCLRRTLLVHASSGTIRREDKKYSSKWNCDTRPSTGLLPCGVLVTNSEAITLQPGNA